MTSSSWQKAKAAMDAAGITKFQIDTDTDYHLFNDVDSNKVIVYDEGTETFYNFRQRIGNGSDGWKDPIIVTACDAVDIHMLKFGATPDKISKFIEEMGLNLDEDQMNAVIKINKGNYDINPITGDYILAGFKVLTEEEIEALTPQEKKDYEKKLEIYNNRSKLGPNQNVQVTY